MLTKQKGDVAMGCAIAYFLAQGYEVCLPIGDKRDYDLIIEKNGGLERVQAKYAGLYADKGICKVALRVMGGNRSFHSAKKYGRDAFDRLFVYTAKGNSFLLPWNELLFGKSVLNIESPKYSEYKILQG